MTALPDWAAGLPLAAKAWKRINYAKPQTSSEPATKHNRENDHGRQCCMCKRTANTKLIITPCVGGDPSRPVAAPVMRYLCEVHYEEEMARLTATLRQ